MCNSHGSQKHFTKVQKDILDASIGSAGRSANNGSSNLKLEHIGRV